MATSQMEADVGEDFAKLFGFKDGWGHIVADGSLANLEGLWYARCIKSIPLALKEVYPEKVADKSEWRASQHECRRNSGYRGKTFCR